MFGEAADRLTDGDTEAAREFYARCDELRAEIEAKIREYMHSSESASHAVPRAILYRYWKRIVANLAGVVTSAVEPLQHQDYLDEGERDITDD